MFDLVEVGEYPRIVAAGYEAFMLGAGATFRLFDYIKIDGILRRRIVGEIIRPQYALLAEQHALWRKLNGARDVRQVVTLQ